MSYKPGRLWMLKIENFGLIENISVPFSRPGAFFVRGVNHDVPGASSNMSGKTTMLNALTWLLYGVDSCGEDQAYRFVGPHGDTARVSGKFTVCDRVAQSFVTFTLTRSRTKSTGSKISIRESKDGASAFCSQEKVNYYFGDSSAFLAAHVFNSAATSFDALADFQKRTLLNLLIGVEDLQQRAAALNNELNALRVLISQHEHKQEKAKAEAQSLGQVLADLKRAEKISAATFALELQTLKQQHTRQTFALRRAEKKLRHKTSAIDKVRMRLKKERDALRTPRIKSLEEEVLDQRLRFNNELLQLAAITEHADDVICPLCDANLHEGFLRSRIDAIKAMVASDEKEKQRYLDRYCTRREARLRRITTLEAHHAELAGAIKIMTTSCEELRTKFTETAAMLEAAGKREDVHAEHIATVSHKITHLNKKWQHEEAVINDARIACAALAPLITAFDEKSGVGIGSYRTMRLFETLNVLASRYSSLVFGDGMRCVYDTKTNGSRRILERVSFRCYDACGIEVVQPSAGQRKRMDVVHAFVLTAAARMTEMKSLDLIVFDEVFTNLDAAGIEAVTDALSALRQDTRTVLVIEHDDDLAAAFDSQYVVTRRDGKATVELVNA